MSSTATVIFPGNTTAVPFNKKSSMAISQNRSQYNHGVGDAETTYEVIGADL